MASNTPHDALFRQVFSRREDAAGELRAVLPSNLAERIDWASLQLVNAHLTDGRLADLESDLVDTAKVGESEVVLYLLFEHQSSVDPLMGFRLLQYMVRIWEDWLEDHKSARRIPAILPVVLSHSESRWTAPVSMLELYELDEPTRSAISPYVPGFAFILDDLRVVQDHELLSRFMTHLGRLALLLLRHGREKRELLGRLVEWRGLVRELWVEPEGSEAFRVLLRYVMLVSEGLTTEQLASALKPAVGEEVGELIMTLGEELLAQGRKEGLKEGQARAVLAVLKSRGLEVADSLRARVLACSDTEQLDRWLTRSLSARTAAEALSDS